jgi:PAS domain S-box-containing protein
MAEIMDKQFSELVHPDDLGFILETNRKRHLGLEVPDNYKVRVIDGKGMTKTINTYVVPIEWNKRPATLNFLTDITEKEKYDDALKESEERYRSVVENAKINILIAQDEVLCYVNPSTAKFIGLSNKELVSRNFLDFIYKEDREKVIENHRLRLSDKNEKSLSENYIIRAYNFKGELRTLDFNTTVIQWDGKPATLNFLIDITDNIESTKLLQKALLEKTILLQEVHHRVKNNLALINSLLSMQIRNASSSDVADSLREAETRIYSIAAVHEGLYRSSSISSIAAEEHFIALGEEIISNYSPDFRIKLDVSAKGCELGLNAAIPISLVINELLTNSIKYAFKGREKGRIYIKMDCTGDYVRLVVGDDGVGVPKDFDLLNKQTLGMTLVRNIIIMQLDGTLELERNEGTRWIITLPHL